MIRFTPFAAFVCCAVLGAVPAVKAQQTLTLGLIPSEDPRLVITEAQPMVDRLARTLNMTVKPFAATDYNGVIEAMRSKKLDLAFFGPFSYVLAVQVAGAEAFATIPIGRVGGSYHSRIIARRDRGLASLADLKGRSFAFVDPASTSGYLFPKAALVSAGYDPETFFGRVVFSGGHDASAIAVQNGKVDAAAVADGLLEAAIARGVVRSEDIVTLWTSEEIPGLPFAMRRDLPPELKQRIVAAFTAMRDVPWGKHGNIDHFVPASDAAYDVVRNAAKVLKLDLKKMK
ncbi:MAG: phosphate/phosphite/phosphonate ABC transporter substrate-binding protein [Betaproteobacteria bacterium]